MKLTDIKRPSFLLELTMNNRTFANVERSMGYNAEVGFEFEFAIPTDSQLYGDADEYVVDTKSIDVDTINNLEQLRQYFVVDSLTEQAITEAAQEWVERVDPDWPAGKPISEDDVDQYIHEVGVGEISADLELSPIHGWKTPYQEAFIERPTGEHAQEDEEREFAATASRVKRSLVGSVKTISTDVRINLKADKRKPEGAWVIEPDSSIEGRGYAVGIELVSPPLPLTKALKALNEVITWMRSVGAETNDSTGLHINISVPNMKQIDLVKLALFMGERHVLQQFQREDNTYTKSQIVAMLDYLKDEKEVSTKNVEALISRLNSWAIANDKYFSFNPTKLKTHEYIEFRAAGGEYDADPSKIKTTVMRFVTVLAVACDRSAYRTQYLKKLISLVSPENKHMAKMGASDDSITDPTSQALKRFVKLDHELLDHLQSLQDDTGEYAVRSMIYSLERINDIIKKYKMQLTIPEKRAIRTIAAAHKMSAQMLVARLRQSYINPEDATPILSQLGLINRTTVKPAGGQPQSQDNTQQ